VRDLALDPTTGDLALSGHALQLTSGKDAVAQKLRVRLRLFLGEWALDTSVGIPYYRDVFTKGVTQSGLQSLFSRAIRSCPGVDALVSLAANVDTATRSSTVSFAVRTTEGDIVAVEDFRPGST
jgi:hypothetical protein